MKFRLKFWSLEMSLPRYFLPKNSYLLTRRCTQRMFLLSPNKAVRRAFKYCLAIASRKFKMSIHVFNVLSNHYHIVLTETSRTVQLPKFMAWLNLHLAKILNKYHGRSENFWSSERFSAVRLVGREAILDKIVYVLTNAVKHRLVERPEQWPGLHCKATLIGEEKFFAKKPNLFFRRKSELPSRALLQLSIPPEFIELGLRRYQSHVIDHVNQRLDDLKDERRQNGQELFGVQRIRAQSPFDTPKQDDSGPSRHPELACKDKSFRQKLLKEIKVFRDSYKDALNLWKNGARDVLFPMGTYLMRVFHRVRCVNSTAPT
jgi:putative transposase